MMMKQVALLLASAWLGILSALNVPQDGCLSGYRWAFCWQLPRYGYAVALAGFGASWSTSGCLPGMEEENQLLYEYGLTQTFCSEREPWVSQTIR